jgi:hypothetical protein
VEGGGRLSRGDLVVSKTNALGPGKAIGKSPSGAVLVEYFDSVADGGRHTLEAPISELWWHAQHVVLAAAQDAARLAAAEDGTPATGRARALDLLQAGLGRDAAGATVQVHRDGELASATVTGRLQPLLPIGDGIRLRATAHSFAEHFRRHCCSWRSLKPASSNRVPERHRRCQD